MARVYGKQREGWGRKRQGEGEREKEQKKQRSRKGRRERERERWFRLMWKLLLLCKIWTQRHSA